MQIFFQFLLWDCSLQETNENTIHSISVRLPSIHSRVLFCLLCFRFLLYCDTSTLLPFLFLSSSFECYPVFHWWFNLTLYLLLLTTPPLSFPILHILYQNLQLVLSLVEKELKQKILQIVCVFQNKKQVFFLSILSILTLFPKSLCACSN